MTATQVQDSQGLQTAARFTWGAWSLRCFALPLRDHGWLVVSPVKGLCDALSPSWNPVRVLFAPNHFHHVGLDEWRARFPEALVVCSDRARPRLSRQHRGLDFRPLEEASGLLPSGVSFLVPEGTRNGEAWLRIEGETGVTWVVSDAFFNVDAPIHGPAGLFLRMTKASPGLSLGNTFKWLATRDRRAYRSWLLRQLEADAPKQVVFGHGETLTGDVPGRLRELVARRLA